MDGSFDERRKELELECKLSGRSIRTGSWPHTDIHESVSVEFSAG